VEVAVVRHQLDTLQSRLGEVERSLAGDVGSGEGMLAELAAAESEYEALRLRQVDAEKARGEVAQKVDRVRQELSRWERDLAVAQERSGSASRRLDQIGSDRKTTRDHLEGAQAQLDALRVREEELQKEFDEAGAEFEAQRHTTSEVRGRLDQARARAEAVEAQERDLARRGVLLEGDAEASEAQAAELERRLERLGEELEKADHAISELQAQGDLFTDRREQLGERLDTAVRELEAAASREAETRSALADARKSELEAADRASSLGARLSALEGMERSQEGVEPAVRGILSAGLKGVMGTLAESIEAPAELATALEGYLGPLARGIVVKDADAAEAARKWFRSDWNGGGGLIVLPLDRVPEPEGALPEGAGARGHGAPWVRALLAGVDVVGDDDLVGIEIPDRVRVSRSGGFTDSLGVVRIGEPFGASGILARREEIKSLRAELGQAEESAQQARTLRAERQEALERLLTEVEERRRDFRAAEDELRAARAEEAAQTDRRSRARGHQEEVARQLEGTRAARTRLLERARNAREDRDSLQGEEEELGEARLAARSDLDTIQEEWEAARGEESRLTIQLTRAEGELERLRERLTDLDASRDGAAARLRALDQEEEQLRAQLEDARRIREEGAEATERLFTERQEAQGLLQERQEALTAIAEAVAESERKVRQVRAAEREASDRRHRLELERQELLGRVGRIEERLEGEWGRPLEALIAEAEPVEGDPDDLQEELRDLVFKIERLGPVNMLAVEEHAEESKRLAFLTEQRDDLVSARDDLRKAIREINQTATGLFDETFQAIRANFREVHFKLFQGGEADLWLADPDDPLESPIEIHACPRGKKTQRIDLLSGGERALTALSLLFSIYLVKPSPFCVLDEVDGPLDENNIGRFIRLLQEFKDRTQFVVITHNPRTIEAADWIYGVTMEEPGVSSIVGVRLDEALEAAGIGT
jgi:chromosome segregation protein